MDWISHRYFINRKRVRGDEIYAVNKQDHGLEQSLDVTKLVPLCKEAIEEQKKVDIILPIKNTDRTTGTILGYHITKRYGAGRLAGGYGERAF